MSTLRKIPPGVGPGYPQVVVLVGATGDLCQRKLLPGLFHLSSTGFIPGCRIIGVSLDDLDAEGFRTFARGALDKFSTRKVDEADWDAFAERLDYVPLSAGAAALRSAVEKAETELGGEGRRLHYLSVPPNAALSVVRMLGEAGLVERSKIIMEKPFGTDLASAVTLNAQAARSVRRRADLPDRSFPRQRAGAEHPRVPLRKRSVRADLEPQLHRSRADRRTGKTRARQPRRHFTNRPAPFATWSSRICSRSSRSWRWNRRRRWSPARSARKRTKSSAA